MTLFSAAPVRVPYVGPQRSASQEHLTTVRRDKKGLRSPKEDGGKSQVGRRLTLRKEATAQSLFASLPAAPPLLGRIEEAAEVRPSRLRAQHNASFPAAYEAEKPPR